MATIVKTISGSIYVVREDNFATRDSREYLSYSGSLEVMNEPAVGGFLVAKDQTGYVVRSSYITDIVEV